MGKGGAVELPRSSEPYVRGSQFALEAPSQCVLGTCNAHATVRAARINYLFYSGPCFYEFGFIMYPGSTYEGVVPGIYLRTCLIIAISVTIFTFLILPIN